MHLGDRYQILEKLGEGGMGLVYKALDTRLDRLVAVKVLPQQRLDDAAAVHRFQREARALARLTHPNIVAVHDFGDHKGEPYLVMELAEGTSLGDLLKRTAPLPIEQATEYVRQAAVGLEHAHAKGLVHRDLKPGNLLLTADGQIKILDLGLARFLQDQVSTVDLTREGSGMGTPDYMAPEQFLDARQADARSDVYALGCTLYHLLTGQPPFPGSSYHDKAAAHQTKVPRGLQEINPALPAALNAVVQRMLAKRPEDRLQTASEVIQALAPFTSLAAPLPTPSIEASKRQPSRAAGSTADTSVAVSSPTGRSQQHPRNLGGLFALVAGACLVLGLGGWLLVNQLWPPNRGGEAVDTDKGDSPFAQNKPSPADKSERPGAKKKERPGTIKKETKAVAPKVEKKPPAVPVLGPGEKRPLLGHTGAVNSLAFSPDGKWLVSGSDDQTVRLWDVATGQGQRLGPYPHRISSVTFAPDSQTVLAAGKTGLDAAVYFWDMRTKKASTPLEWKWNISWGLNVVYSLALSPDQKQLALGGYGPVQVWDLPNRTRRDLRWSTMAFSYAYAVAFSLDGKVLAAGCHSPEGDAIWLWEADTGQALPVLRGVAKDNMGRHIAQAALAFSPDGKLLARVTKDATISTTANLFLAERTGDGVGVFIRRGVHPVPGGGVFAVRFTPSGKLLVAAADAFFLLNKKSERLGEVRLWDLESKKVQLFQADARSEINALALSPDGTLLAAGSEDGTILLWGLSGEKK